MLIISQQLQSPTGADGDGDPGVLQHLPTGVWP
jgi:hypothetical protein